MPTLEAERRDAIDQAIADTDGLAEWNRTYAWLTGSLVNPDTAADRADAEMAEAGWYRTRHGWRRA